MAESQAAAMHILGACSRISRRPRRSPNRWMPLFCLTRIAYCSGPSSPALAMTWLESSRSAICRYSMTFNATASSRPLRARPRISWVVSNTFGLYSTTRFMSWAIRFIQTCIAARASFRFTSPTTLSEIARRNGAPTSAVAGAAGNQPDAPNIRARARGVAN